MNNLTVNKTFSNIIENNIINLKNEGGGNEVEILKPQATFDSIRVTFKIDVLYDAQIKYSSSYGKDKTLQLSIRDNTKENVVSLLDWNGSTYDLSQPITLFPDNTRYYLFDETDGIEMYYFYGNSNSLKYGRYSGYIYSSSDFYNSSRNYSLYIETVEYSNALYNKTHNANISSDITTENTLYLLAFKY